MVVWEDCQEHSCKCVAPSRCKVLECELQAPCMGIWAGYLRAVCLRSAVGGGHIRGCWVVQVVLESHAVWLEGHEGLR